MSPVHSLCTYIFCDHNAFRLTEICYLRTYILNYHSDDKEAHFKKQLFPFSRQRRWAPMTIFYTQTLKFLKTHHFGVRFWLDLAFLRPKIANVIKYSVIVTQ